MGACCSSPVEAASADEISTRVPSADVPRHQEGAVQDVVHAFATVHTAHTHDRQHSSHRHHPHEHRQGHAVHTRSIKQLLRAASPPQPQQQLYGLSPRSYNHLQQLLPAAPMQQLAQLQSQHSGQAQHGKQVALRSNSSSAQRPKALSGLLASTHHSISNSDQAVSHTLGERLNSTSSIPSSAGTPRSTSTAAEPATGQHSKSPAEALSPMQVLAVCGAGVQEEAAFQAAGITPLLLASLCLIESGGCPRAKRFRDHLGDCAHGLCQVLLSTAQWLATNQGFDKHGTCPTSKDLQEPKTCVYFAAAYLTLLSNSGGVPRSEGFVVRAYNAGPKGVDTAAALTYLQKYLKAKHCLTQVANAMAVTLAAAAFEVDIQLPDAAVPADAAPSTDALAGLCSKAGLSVSDDGTDKPSKDQGSSCTNRADDLGGQACRTASSSNPAASSSPSNRQVMVRQAAASCVAALSSDWLAPQQAVSSPQAAPAGSTGAGGLLAHMLQSRWGFSGSQQQQQGQYAWPGSSTRGCGSALALAPVAAADLCTAWQRMVCISPSVAHTALERAAAAAALAPLPTRQLPEASSSSLKAALAPAAAAPAGPADMWLGRTAADSSSTAVKGSSSRGSSRKAPSPAAAATTPQLDSMPCVIHVVGAGETLEHIASICSMELSELLAANPDVVGADAVHHNDCIAVPVPVVFPRLYVVQHGDTLHTIARAHEVPLGRLLAKNPELTDPTRVQPGWVVALPGLKGDSQVALPADWLLQAPVAGTHTPPQQALWSGAVTVSAAGQNADVQVASWQRVQEEVPAAGAGRAAQGGVSLQRSRSQPRQRSRSRTQQQQGQQDAVDMHLPSVGSGAFMFTVGSPGIASSSSLTSNASSARAAAGMPQRQLSAGRQGGRPVDRLKGSSGSSGVVPGNSLELARSWTVGTDASDVH